MTTLTIHPLFGDHAVLQRGRPLPIHGTASAGATVEARLAGRHGVTSADGDGRWVVRFDPLEAGGPYTIEVVASDGATAVARDVLVGDVFLCSGQSNMEWPLWDSDGGAAAAEAAADSKMRLLTVPRRPSSVCRADLDATWRECTPASAPAFSAVAFYGNRALRREFSDITVGMVAAAWGGTRIEPWISPAGLQSFPKLCEDLVL